MSNTPFLDRVLLGLGTRVRPLVTRSTVVSGRKTQVFCGEPGEVVRPAESIYTRLIVRFASGAEIGYLPYEVAPVTEEDATCPFDLRSQIVLVTRIGSHAHGMAHDDSDDDLRGVFAAPSDLEWSLRETPRRIEYLRDGLDEVYYELGGFVRRLLMGDPMCFETLYSPLVVEKNTVGEVLLAQRADFLTKTALLGFPMAMRDQMRDLERRQRKGRTVKNKALMHTLRLVNSSLRALRTGEFSLDAGEWEEDYRAIRDGKWPFGRVRNEVYTSIRAFMGEIDGAELPDGPATEAADRCLISGRAWAAERYLKARAEDR